MVLVALVVRVVLSRPHRNRGGVGTTLAPSGSTPTRRKGQMVSVESEYRGALDGEDFDLVQGAYGALPYREWTIFHEKTDRVRVRVRCPWYDFIFNILVPWEGTKGSWRIEVSDRTVFYAYDDYGNYAPDCTERERQLITKHKILRW